jgi:hypothetical protein
MLQIGEIVSVQQAIQILDVKRKTFLDRHWRRRNNIRAVRRGRRVVGITAEDLRAALQREQHNGGGGR